MKRSGFTLLEALVSLVLLGILAVALGKLFVPIKQFFMHSIATQTTSMEGRMTMDTVTHLLHEGLPNTVAICNCVNPLISNPLHCAQTGCQSTTSTSVAPPYSQIEFYLQGNTTNYIIYWAENSVQMVSYYSGLNPHQTTLATHAVDLKFSQVSSDPSIIYVTMTSSAAVDSSGNSGHSVGISFDRQEVHMGAS